MKYLTMLYNDAAIANGTKVPDVLTMPFDGYIIAACLAGAGCERWTLETSDGLPSQEAPARDIAIDADSHANSVEGDGILPGGFVQLNQPCSKNTKISYTPHGTGTAEANLFVIVSREALGLYILNQHDVVDYSGAAQGDTVQECPTVSGLSRIARAFIRGAGLNDTTIQFGTAGGLKTTVRGRAIAENTDAEPFVYSPIGAEIPDRLVFDSMNGGTGNVHHYVQYE